MVLYGVCPQRFDNTGLLQGCAVGSQLMVIQALATSGASLQMRSGDAGDLLGAFKLLDNLTIAPLQHGSSRQAGGHHCENRA